MKNQKGFIPIIFIIIGAVVIASATFGVVKYKDEITARIFKSKIEVLEVEVPDVDLIEEEVSEEPEGDNTQKLQEQLRIAEQKRLEAKRLKKEAEEKRKAEETARIVAEEQARQEQNKQALDKYLKRIVETEKRFYQQLLQEIQEQIAEKEALVQQSNNLYTQISQIDQQMTNIEQKINMLPYTVREEVRARIKAVGAGITQSGFERRVASEIQQQEGLLRQEWWDLNSQKQPLVSEYNLLRGNPILDYQPQYPPQLPSIGDYVFQYGSAGKVSYIINPDYTESYVYYTGNGKVDYVLNPDGSKMNFYYLGNGQLDRISGF